MKHSAPTPLRLDFDCWVGVLKYFQYDLVLDSAEEVREKRKSLYALALLARPLTDPALDLLWESMNTLKPIVHVVNAFASSGSLLAEIQLEYHARPWVSPGVRFWV